MNPSSRPNKDLVGRSLDVEEIRLIADLRVMHSKVNELYGIVEYLKKRHAESDIVKYADYEVLAEDIRKSDAIYLWFVGVKESRDSAGLRD
jgi:hypothetical protein